MDTACLRTAMRLVMVASLFLFGCSDGGPRGGSGTRVDSGTTRADAGPGMMCGSGSCPVGTTCCNDSCAQTQVDVANCGACGNACAAGQSCVAGMCTGSGPNPGTCSPSCSSSQRCCGSSCVNISPPAGVLDGRGDSSFQNCNGCGLACDMDRSSVCGTPLGGSGPPQCLCGNLNQCAPGQACVPQGSSFICANLQSDPMNCGSVGNSCGEGESCVAGVCGCGGTGASCGSGQACCGGSCVDVTSDATNCGACGNVCGANAPSCISGSCACGTAGRICQAPVAGPGGFGGEPGESCCDDMCVPNTNTSCGCGVTCGDGQNCGVGMGILPIPGAPMDTIGVCCDPVPFIGCGDFGLPGGGGGLPFP